MQAVHPLPLFSHAPPLGAHSPNFALSKSVPKPTAAKPLWALLAALLPSKMARAEFYSPAELARVVGVGTPAVLHHCRALFPFREGQYRLTRSEAEMVLARICSTGRKLPSRESVEARLREQEAAQ